MRDVVLQEEAAFLKVTLNLFFSSPWISFDDYIDISEW